MVPSCSPHTAISAACPLRRLFECMGGCCRRARGPWPGALPPAPPPPHARPPTAASPLPTLPLLHATCRTTSGSARSRTCSARCGGQQCLGGGQRTLLCGPALHRSPILLHLTPPVSSTSLPPPSPPPCPPQYGKVVSIDMKAPVRPPAFAFVEFRCVALLQMQLLVGAGQHAWRQLAHALPARLAATAAYNALYSCSPCRPAATHGEAARWGWRTAAAGEACCHAAQCSKAQPKPDGGVEQGKDCCA